MAKKPKNEEIEATEAPEEAPQDTGSEETDREPADIGEAVQQHRDRLERADKIRGW